MPFFNRFTYYKPHERRALLLLCLILSLAVTALMLQTYRQTDKGDTLLSAQDTVLEAFLTQIQKAEEERANRPRNNYRRERDTVYVYRYRNTPRKTSPHKTPSRPNGAKTDTTPNLLLPLPAYTRVEKYPMGTTVNLNRADTTELKKIPGIGSVIARMIVEYRERLGGFYDVEQLREIRIDAAKLEPWFEVVESDIKRMDVNESSLDQLRKHPYINFYQAKALTEYCRKHGRMNSLKPLLLYEEFSEADMERIGHYLSFD